VKSRDDIVGNREKGGQSFGFGRVALFGRGDDQLDAETRNRYRLRWREAVRGPSAPRALLASVRMTEGGCGNSEPVPASLARSCPRSFRFGRVAPFGQDDRYARVARFGQDDGVGAGVAAEPNPLTPFPYKEGGTEKGGAQSFRSALLGSVRMTDFGTSPGAVDFRWGRTSIYNGRQFRQCRKYVTYVGITGS